MPVILVPKLSPNAPDKTSICTEALEKCGYAQGTVQFNSKLVRATNQWLEEVKNDIFNVIKNPKYLQTTIGWPTVIGVSRYSWPVDFSQLVSLTLMDGENRGTFGTGSTITSFVFSASDNYESDDLIGKEVLVTSGQATGQIAQVISYDNITKIAVVSGPTLNPANGDSYLITDSYTTLEEDFITEHDKLNHSTARNKPYSFYPYGKYEFGEFELIPNPDKIYGMKIRYYVDLLQLDLNSSTMETLYRRWRNVWTQGVYVKALKDAQDSRVDMEEQKYNDAVKLISMREGYGQDFSNIQMRISE